MKQFIAFVKKEFHHILRDRRTMLILIGMPIVQIILFGFAISTEVRNVQTAILTPSIRPFSRRGNYANRRKQAIIELPLYFATKIK